MKKTVFTILSAFFCTFTLTAQTVTNLGTTTINRTISDSPIGDLTIGNYPSSWAGGSSTYYRCVYTAQPQLTKSYNIGVDSRIVNTTNLNNYRAIGVRGIAGRTTNGYNYGVLGGIVGDMNGAGIFGTISSHTGVYVNGRYAGYFDGNTYVNGNLYAGGYYTLSDAQLVYNVVSVNNNKALDKILGMNVIEFNLKQIDNKEEKDTATVAEDETVIKMRAQAAEQRHYGVLAQELQKHFPNLVEKGQDGYLQVNYLELVPILIQSIQELKQEVDELKAKNGTASDGIYKVIKDKQIILTRP